MAKVVDLLRSLSDPVRFTAAVANVYGEPVNLAGRIVIPVARVAYGFGAGGAGAEGEHSGGAAGMAARPVGALEITEAGTRFIPFTDRAALGLAAAAGVLLGIVLGWGMAARRPTAPN
jgi:uncharacterized spore protein YtfJ